MGPDRDRTSDPWTCSQTRICSQTCYQLRYAARQVLLYMYLHITGILLDSEFFLICHLITQLPGMLNLNISRFENSDSDPEQHDNGQQRGF